MSARNPAASLIAVKERTWQARKSASTRLQILEATLDCFIERGYSATTTTEVASRAGVSRGAMLHHFPTRGDVVRAAIEHLHAKRLAGFRAAAAALPNGEDRLRGALEAFWEQMHHPLYQVFLELSVLSRTDPELAAIVAPSRLKFEQELRRTALELFPEWQALGDHFNTGFEIGTLIIDGSVLAALKRGRMPPKKRLLAYLEQRLREIAELPRTDDD